MKKVSILSIIGLFLFGGDLQASWTSPILIDTVANSPFNPLLVARNDSIYVIYSNHGSNEGNNKFVRSLDDGVTWANYFILPNGHIPSYADIKVDSDTLGIFYAYEQFPYTHHFIFSTNFGESWDFIRHITFPFLVYDGTFDYYRATAAICGASALDGYNYSLILRSSHNFGESWPDSETIFSYGGTSAIPSLYYFYDRPYIVVAGYLNETGRSRMQLFEKIGSDSSWTIFGPFGRASISEHFENAGSMSICVTKPDYIPFGEQILIDDTNSMRVSDPAKPLIELPALIWNPYHIASGDSIYSSLTAAGYEATLTDNISPFFDSLNNYHLFIMGGIYEYGDSLIDAPLFVPLLPQILSFLDNGGRAFWEGTFSLTLASDTSVEFWRYFKAGSSDHISEPFSYLRGRDSTFFANIDSLGYERSTTDGVMGDWEWFSIGEPIEAPEAGPSSSSKAAVCVYNNSRTMATNFSWSRLHDGFTNTRRDLIIDVMNWLSEPVVGVEEEPVPEQFSLSQNYPNPFNAQTTIRYSLPKQSMVSIDIFDILGRKIERLAEGIKPAGNHQAIWDASGQASGIYFYRIKAGDKGETKKMVLTK